MKLKILTWFAIFLIFLTFNINSYAEEANINTNICDTVTQYKPAGDVEYVPGQDVQGRNVQPADLPDNSGQINLPEKIEFPLTLKLAERLSDDQALENTEMDAAIGLIQYNLKTGKMTLDGKDITSQVFEYCNHEFDHEKNRNNEMPDKGGK